MMADDMTDTTVPCFNCQQNAHLLCSRCRVARYCSVNCQRAHFAAHKASCVPPAIEIVPTMEFDEIQDLVSGCKKGGVIHFSSGVFKPSAATREVDSQRKERQADGSLGVGSVSLPVPLLITRAITLKGSCTRSATGIEDETVLPFGIVIDPSGTQDAAGGKLVICNLKIKVEIEIKENAFQRIELSTVMIDANAHRIPEYILRVDALKIGECRGAKGVLLNHCEIYGGWDGIDNNGSNTRLHIKDCEIRFACCRGIFSNNHFTIEDSEVSNCGSYGIKDRGGRTMLGDNDIQTGPWDENSRMSW